MPCHVQAKAEPCGTLSMDTDAARKLGLDPDLSETQLLNVAATLLSRVVCAVEAALCLLNIPTFWISDTVDYIDASPPSQRKRTVGGGGAHATMFKTPMQRYIMRPTSTKFNDLTFTEYHDCYTVGTAQVPCASVVQHCHLGTGEALCNIGHAARRRAR